MKLRVRGWRKIVRGGDYCLGLRPHRADRVWSDLRSILWCVRSRWPSSGTVSGSAYRVFAGSVPSGAFGTGVVKDDWGRGALSCSTLVIPAY